MRSSVTHDPIRAAFELREQLASDKRRMGFFLGAGTSMSVGVPGIDDLTTRVEEALLGPTKAQFTQVKSGLDGKPNVEDVLNRVRLYREFIGTSVTKEIDGLSGAAAKALDAAICKAIYDIVRVDPPQGIKPHLTLAQWLHALHGNRDCPIEIFTTNYDLLLERAMEQVGVPFFDGFVGSVAPFFVPESVEADGTRGSESIYPPKSWTRLWKIHGSIGWHLRNEGSSGKARIARLTDCAPEPGEELMIFPSREKYADSRKLPFLTYQDKLRKFLSSGEAMLLVVGYRFSDDHLNEIIFQGLRSNSRLAVTALMFGARADPPAPAKLALPDQVVAYGETYRNLTVLGPDRACIGGMLGEWAEPTRKRKDNEAWPFWDDVNKRFTLGDFNALASYLERFIGFHALLSGTQAGSSPAARGSEDTGA